MILAVCSAQCVVCSVQWHNNTSGYDQCAVCNVKYKVLQRRNNMSGYDQGTHLASLAQTQLSQATARANALALIADVQPACD